MRAEQARERTKQGIKIHGSLDNITNKIYREALKGYYDTNYEFAFNELPTHLEYVTINSQLREWGYQTESDYNENNQPVSIYINWRRQKKERS